MNDWPSNMSSADALEPDAAHLREELRLARLEIQALRARLAETAPEMEDLRRQAAAARHRDEFHRRQVTVLRQSLSWRLTRPLRRARRRRTDG